MDPLAEVSPIDDKTDAVAPLAVARDATAGAAGSFEFASFQAEPGRVLALVADAHRGVRDMLLALAGLLKVASGSLTVCGEELATAGPGARRRLRYQVGMGALESCAPVDLSQTVERALTRELSLRKSDADALEVLARFRLATVSGARVETLRPSDRARLSAALALAGAGDGAPAPRVALVDLEDPFCAGLSADAARAVVAELRAIARATGAAVIVGTCDAAVACAADAMAPLDMGAAEALERARAASGAYVGKKVDAR